MSGSRFLALYGHLLDCQHCCISDMRFCAGAGDLGADYREYVDGFAPEKRNDMHESFVSAVVRGRVKRWWDSQYQHKARAA